VAEALSVLRVAMLGEVVHVELADEGGEVVVLEVSWKHLLSELIRLVHDEASPVLIPAHCVTIRWVIDDFIGLNQKIGHARRHLS